ncbi:MAG: 3-keto-disaccharide hydrolase [Armatimonadota bacterium]
MLIQTLGIQPPQGAVVLFDGTSLDGWTKMDGSPVEWIIRDGAIEVVPRTGDICTEQLFGDHFLHLEFRLSDMPEATGQAKANSGVFVQGRYEIQVLDSSGWDIPGLGDCGAIYNQYAPLTNACRPALEWQAYDVIFRAPRCEGKVVKENARLTVLQNGIVIHNNVELPGVTGAPTDLEVQLPGHLRLQDHGNTIWYRNIWAVPLPKEGANAYPPMMKSR